VKNSRKYYDDASQVLAELMLQAVRPDQRVKPIISKVRLTEERLAMVAKNQTDPDKMGAMAFPGSPMGVNRQISTTQDDLDRQSDGGDSTVTNSKPTGPDEELRCVIAVVRHGAFTSMS
jgi:hypothetical protein